MSKKSLLIFVTVYKEESITAAARKLSISQPAVSAAIRELETHYGTHFFERQGRGIKKTQAAHHFFEFAAHITSLYVEMDSHFKNQYSAIPLRIGASPDTGSHLIPAYLPEYLRLFPVPMPHIQINHDEVIEQLLLNNTLDFALTEGRIQSNHILTEPLIAERLLLICSPKHRLAAKETVTLDDLREEPFLMQEQQHADRRIAESALLLQDFILKPIWESTSTTALVNAVTANLGLSILPERVVAQAIAQHQLLTLQLNNLTFHKEYKIIYHQNKHLFPAMIHFIEFIKQLTNL